MDEEAEEEVRSREVTEVSDVAEATEVFAVSMSSVPSEASETSEASTLTTASSHCPSPTLTSPLLLPSPHSRVFPESRALTVKHCGSEGELSR